MANINRKGRVLYVPPVVLTELDDIIREDRLPSKADAFKEMTRYTRVGREVKRMAALDFSKSVKLPNIDQFYRKKRRGGAWL